MSYVFNPFTGNFDQKLNIATEISGNIALNDGYISNDGGDEGITIDNAGNVDMSDGTNEILKFNVENPGITIRDDADTANYFNINVGDNGATQIKTVNQSGSTANLVFTVDGYVQFGGTFQWFTTPLLCAAGIKTASGTTDYTFKSSETLNLPSGDAGGSDVHYGLWYDQTQTDITGWDSVYLMYLDGGNKFTVDDKAKLFMDINLASTTAATNRGIHIDIDKTGDVSSGTDNITGIYTDISTSGASGGNVNSIGHTILVAGDSGGNSQATGINVRAIGADNNYAILTSGGNVGIGVDVPTALLEVEQGSSGGGIAFKIDNDDTDEIAMSIEAANIDADVIDISADAITTVNVIDITADGLTSGKILNITSTGTLTGSIIDITADSATTGKGINISMDALTSGNMLYLDDDSASTTARNCVSIIQNNDAALDATALLVQSDAGGTGMKIDKNYPAALVAADTVTGLHVDFVHTAPSSGTATMIDIGIDLDVTSGSIIGATHTTYGMDIDVVGATAGTHRAVGIAVDVGSADTNYAALFNGGNVGIGEVAPQDTLEVNGTILVKDALKFTQDDGDEYIDSLNDGYLDIDATTGIRLKQNTLIEGTRRLYFYNESTEYIAGNDNDLTLVANRDITFKAGRGVNFLDSTVGFTAQDATGDGTTTIDWQAGNKFHLLLAASTNETITFGTNPGSACNLLLKLKQPASGAGCTVDWTLDSGTLYWVGGGTDETGEPTLSTGVNDVDIITFYYDGANYYGVASLGFDA